MSDPVESYKDMMHRLGLFANSYNGTSGSSSEPVTSCHAPVAVTASSDKETQNTTSTSEKTSYVSYSGTARIEPYYNESLSTTHNSMHKLCCILL